MNRSIIKTPFQQVSVSQPTQDIPRSRASQTATPTHEDIARRAYEIYLEKGRPLGQNEQIMQQAKQERWYKGLVEMRRAIRNNLQFPV
jgi:hypothetical protein